MKAKIQQIIESPKTKEWVERLTQWMDYASSRINMEGTPANENSKIPIARGPIIFGLWCMAIAFGGFGLWATFAPLASAAVAKGVVVLDSNKKTIQHLEGGIIDKILVHEGKFVEAGEPLVILSETAARARLDLIGGQYYAEKATLARLMAERDQAPFVIFPDDLLFSDDLRIAEILDSQRQIFDTRRKALEGEVSVLRERILQHREEITGLESQQQSSQKQIALLNDEISVVEKLLASGNAARPRLLALQRNAAELQGRRGEYLAQISRAQQSISEIEVQIINRQNEHLKEVVDQIRETQVSVATLAEQHATAQDVLNRLEVVAPQSGIVTGLKFHTKGGVIGPGDAIMDIVPQDDRLIIEAQVSTQDIDVVHQGLPARVRLTAYKTRKIPPVEGTVLSVSADRFVDNVTGQPYYLARVMVDQEQLDNIKDVALHPGMPAEVLIVTGDRTLMSYLITPLTDSFFRAFREE